MSDVCSTLHCNIFIITTLQYLYNHCTALRQWVCWPPSWVHWWVRVRSPAPGVERPRLSFFVFNFLALDQDTRIDLDNGHLKSRELERFLYDKFHIWWLWIKETECMKQTWNQKRGRIWKFEKVAEWSWFYCSHLEPARLQWLFMRLAAKVSAGDLNLKGAAVFSTFSLWWTSILFYLLLTVYFHSASFDICHSSRKVCAPF